MNKQQLGIVGWQFFSGQGGRAKQEDYALPQLPLPESAAPRFFMVCDGMGGHAAGHVASQLVAHAVADFLTASAPAVLTPQIAQAATAAAQQRLKDYVANESPFASGLGTTLALLYQNADGTLSAVHCGDSRVYHFRAGKCLWHTKDHTYVQSLVDDGVITPEAAVTHSRRNILLRSINSGQNSVAKSAIQQINDLASGDVVLLCSDGVYDGLSASDLTAYLSQSPAIDRFAAALNARAAQQQGDNYTAWVLLIGEKQGAATAPRNRFTEKKQIQVLLVLITLLIFSILYQLLTW